MDKISINGIFLIVPQDFTIAYQAESPLFQSQLGGEWSLPFRIPNDNGQVNARILQYPFDGSVIKNETPLCTLHIGEWEIQAQYLLKSASTFYFEMSVFRKVIDIEEVYKNKTIREIFGEERIEFMEAPHPRFRFEASGGGTGTVNFTVNGFTYEIAWDTDMHTTLLDISTAVNIDTLVNGVTMEVDGEEFEIIQNADGPAITIIYSDVISSFGAFTDWVLLDDVTWLIDYNDALNIVLNESIEQNYPDTNYCFPTMSNKKAYGLTAEGTPDKNPDFSGFINVFDSDITRYLMNVSSDETFEGNKYSLSPQIFYAYVWNKIFTDNEISYAGDFIDHVDFNKLYFYNNYLLDVSVELYSDANKYITFASGIRISDCLPDISVKDFILQIINKFNLAVYPDECYKKVYFETKNSKIIQPKRVDWISKLHLSSHQIFYDQQLKGYLFSHDQDPADDIITEGIYSDQHADVQCGDGSTEHNCAIGTCSMDIQSISGVATIYIPIVKQECSSTEMGYNEFSFRLLIYRGLNSNLSGNSYPYGTNDDTFEGVEIEGALSLQTQKLYDNSYKNWCLFFINSIIIQNNFKLSIADLINLNWFKEYTFEEGSHFIESFEIESSTNEYKIVRIEMRRSVPGKNAI